MSRMIRAGLLFALLLAPLALPTLVRAADIAIGVIDVDRLSREYKGYQIASERLNAFRVERMARYRLAQGGLGLTEAEFQEYQQLIQQSVRMEVVEQRIKVLQETARRNVERYKALAEKPREQLSAEEAALLVQLDKQLATVSAILNELYQELSDEVQAEWQRYHSVLSKLVDAAIADIAKKRKLTLVLSRSVQTESGSELLVLWGGTDITDDVLKALNDTFNPAVLEQAQ